MGRQLKLIRHVRIVFSGLKIVALKIFMLEIPSLTGTNKHLLYVIVKRDAPASSGISSCSRSKGMGAQCADRNSYV